MISCVNPSYISSNHTINTLRYSDRLKELTVYMQKQIGKGKIIQQIPSNNNNHPLVVNQHNGNKIGGQKIKRQRKGIRRN